MLRWIAIFGCCLIFSTAFAVWQTRSPERRRPESPLGPATGDVDNFQPKRVLQKPIRAIVDPTIVSASDAQITDNELVIGVEVNGQSRAYSINQLTGPLREIINDELGDTPIAATW